MSQVYKNWTYMHDTYISWSFHHYRPLKSSLARVKRWDFLFDPQNTGDVEYTVKDLPWHMTQFSISVFGQYRGSSVK